jgi:hypothetical protein
MAYINTVNYSAVHFSLIYTTKIICFANFVKLKNVKIKKLLVAIGLLIFFVLLQKNKNILQWKKN